MLLEEFIKLALEEDIADGDHTTLACVSEKIQQSAKLLVKEDGILAGVEIAKQIYKQYDPQLKMEILINDGSKVTVGDIAFKIHGSARTILTTERLVLNIMQRMSGIATISNKVVSLVKDTGCIILDTRKTTPLFRWFEKEAVKIGGAQNHRFGLYDMIMIKDNHVDYSGGITKAVTNVKEYLQKNKKRLDIEVEVRNFNELNEVLSLDGIKRVMLDNFNTSDLKKAVELIKTTKPALQTEASGGITIANVKEYALTGVQYISIGALTHSIKSLDLSLKAIDG